MEADPALTPTWLLVGLSHLHLGFSTGLPHHTALRIEGTVVLKSSLRSDTPLHLSYSVGLKQVRMSSPHSRGGNHTRLCILGSVDIIVGCVLETDYHKLIISK